MTGPREAGLDRLTTVTSVAEIAALVDYIGASSRTGPLVIVTTKAGASRPLVDAGALAAEIAPVPVFLISTGPLTWEMTALLPEGFSVFGGACRVYRPGWTPNDPLERHPLLFTWSADKAAATYERILDALDAVGRVHRVPPPPKAHPTSIPAVDSVVIATVLEAMPGGAEVRINRDLSGWYRLPRKSAPVSAGDRLQVRFVALDEEGRAVLATPPRQRVTPASTKPAPLLPKPTPPGPRTTSEAEAAEPLAGEEDDRDELILQLQTELRSSRDECLSLRSQLAELEERVTESQAELRNAVRDARSQVQDLRRSQRALRDRNQRLEEQLHGRGQHDDGVAQFRHEIEVAWGRIYHGADAGDWPLRTFSLGEDFLDELEALEGIERSKVVEVCVDVITGRAMTMPSREHHALRTGEGGDDRQRRRFSDGAVAYRVSLQINTPSARRLHYWLTPDNSVELANVGTHDRMDIS